MAAQIEEIFVDVASCDVFEQLQRSVEVAGRGHRSRTDYIQDESVRLFVHQRAGVAPGALEDRFDPVGAHRPPGVR